jgi:hypothetical protein
MVPEKHWWDKTKDIRVEPGFRNVLQETFYYNYKYLPMNTNTGLREGMLRHTSMIIPDWLIWSQYIISMLRIG